MDKNAIKRYAVWARRELIDRVSTKAQEFGITEEEIVPASADSIKGHLLTKTEKAQRTALIEQINKNGYKQVIEGVAYTWFNRFSALRFMEVNGYLPTHIRVFTDEENNFKPQILAEAIHLELDGLQMDKVYELKQENKTEELFKYLIITQCNALGAILPGMFQKIEDYTELLFPDNLLREGSVIQQMIEMIPEKDWTEQVQIIGWLYQYYNTEPKDVVFANLKKNIKISKENIPAATQIFTPDWIVRYMVENSLGRLWIEGHPNDKLKASWEYYLDEATQETAARLQIDEIRAKCSEIKPEEIKVIDPCMGSGHILAYMFDVLIQIYDVYGYSIRDAVKYIVEKNICGLDIDDRAAQLSYFSVMMKARQYDKRFFSRKDAYGKPDVPQPRVFVIEESNNLDNFAVNYFINNNQHIEQAFKSLVRDMHDAKEYGSILNISPIDFNLLYERVDEVMDDISLHKKYVIEIIVPLIQIGELLAQKYDVVVTNPPYMNALTNSPKLAQFVRDNYPDSKADLFSVFIEKGIMLLKKHGYSSLVTMQSWMFLSSFEKMRKKLLSNCSLVNLMHMDNMVMGIAFGTSVSIFRKEYIADYKGTYNYISFDDIKDDIPFEFPVTKNRFSQVNVNRYASIPGQPIAYWLSNEFASLFEGKTVRDFADPCIGMRTGDNDRFLRFWYEISHEKMCIGALSAEQVEKENKKWVPYLKGGNFRKWYGNHEYVVNWEHNGLEIKENTRKVYPQLGDNLGWKISNEQYYFQEGVSWTSLSSGDTAFRRYPCGYIFSNSGQAVVNADTETLDFLTAVLNTKVSKEVLDIITPTMGFESGYIAKIPVVMPPEDLKRNIIAFSRENIQLSTEDWDSLETSWDFKQHPLVRLRNKSRSVNNSGTWQSLIKDAYFWWENECLTRYSQLKSNEEELNRIFITTYGLQNELIPDVEDKGVTVRKADPNKDIRSFISYAVGCMFGRYSFDEDGLILAGEDFGTKFTYATVPLTGTGITGSPSSFTYTQGDCYLKKKDGSVQKCSFAPDKDNILPICDDEYFEDDIVGKFVRFVATVYGDETLEENLRFIAEALGGKGAPREVIRNYFLNDFYNDHLKIYQKRPIYWQFDSGKKNGFKCLIYMHRYQPDTIARIRTDYVHEQQARYRTAIAGVEQRIANASTAERVRLNKQLVKLKDQEAEIHAFEEKIHHLADQMIRIDLDDGVKHNYEIFKDVLTKIK